MKLIDAITNTRLLLLITALLIVSGLAAFTSLPRAEDPIISNRFANVTTSFPGASADRVETLVTEVVENKLRELSEVKLLTSSSRPGVSIVTIELKDEVTEPEPTCQKPETNFPILNRYFQLEQHHPISIAIIPTHLLSSLH